MAHPTRASRVIRGLIAASLLAAATLATLCFHLEIPLGDQRWLFVLPTIIVEACVAETLVAVTTAAALRVLLWTLTVATVPLLLGAWSCYEAMYGQFPARVDNTPDYRSLGAGIIGCGLIAIGAWCGALTALVASLFAHINAMSADRVERG